MGDGVPGSWLWPAQPQLLQLFGGMNQRTISESSNMSCGHCKWCQPMSTPSVLLHSHCSFSRYDGRLQHTFFIKPVSVTNLLILNSKWTINISYIKTYTFPLPAGTRLSNSVQSARRIPVPSLAMPPRHTVPPKWLHHSMWAAVLIASRFLGTQQEGFHLTFSEIDRCLWWKVSPQGQNYLWVSSIFSSW